MWPDNETPNDLIGFQVHADLIRAVVTNPKMLPTIIGVFGDWGGGKTSIMKMLERDLDPAAHPAGSTERAVYEHVAVLYFNTWLFEGYDDAKSAILTSILLQLGEHKRFGPKVREKVVSLLKSVNWMRLARLSLKHVAVPAAAAFVTGGASLVPAAIAASVGIGTLISKPGDADKKESKEGDRIDWENLMKEDQTPTDVLDVRTFRSRFEKMLKDSDIKSLVVLVDDLDRCNPDRIIDNLEAIKLFLNVDHTAFVIGADRRIVEHAIRDKYAHRAADQGDREQTDRLVKDYLEKLVQIPYSLPRLSATEIETYMTLLFCQRHLPEEKANDCLKACNESRSKNRYASFGYAAVRAALKNDNPEPPLAEALALTVAAAPLIADGLKGNPRQVKRFLNALLLRKELARVATLDNIRDAVLIKLMILEYVHPDLFTQLFGWQSQQNGHPQQIADLETALTGAKGDVNDEESARKIDGKWAATAVRRWVAMQPLLRDVDLRDYFWVARDRLESTFSGIAMVPPLVRTVLEGLVSGSTPKRNAAMKTAPTLAADERAILLTALDQRLRRQPEDQEGYNALQYLAEVGISEAVQLLANVLLQRPLDNVPPTVGMQLMTLYNAKPEYQAILDPAREHLGKSQTKIGKAIQAAKSVKK
jgi:hypothetical protein